MFKGSITALITPMRDGQVDEDSFRGLVNWQIEEGTSALVPCGTTGESPTLNHDEHKRVVEICIKVAAGRVPVIAGTGSNCTAEGVELAEHAKAAGAAAQLSVVPYYNKPTQAGMKAHFTAMADAGPPLIIYNIPPRSVVDMSIETMAELAKHPNIVGVKDATMDLARPLATRITCGADFSILSGEDATALALLAQSGDGCISVTSNIAPRICAEMHAAWAKGGLCRGPAHQRGAAAAARFAVLRIEPGAGKIRRQPDGAVRAGHPPAADADCRQLTPAGRGDVARPGHA